MLSTYTAQRRPSWRGVLAGLVMGLIVVMAMIAIALILSSFLPFDLKGTSIAAGIYAAITAIVSAYVAGYYAIKFSAPEALFGDGTDIDPNDASLTGMLTAALIVLLTTFFAMSSATSILATAGNAVGSTVSTVAKTTAATASAGASVVGTAAAGTAAAAPEGTIQQVQQRAQEVYQKVSGEISQEDVRAMVAKNTQNLNEQQIAATTDVLYEMMNNTKEQVADMDFTSIDTWRNIDDYAKQRMASIEQTLQGPELITRLEEEGLTEAQAIEVRSEVTESFNEYKMKTEQYIAQAQQTVDQGLDQAEDIARKAALYSGLFWLISAILTFIACTFGAKSAAANYRLDKPIVTWGNNVK